jgi:hypothetical protein
MRLGAALSVSWDHFRSHPAALAMMPHMDTVLVVWVAAALIGGAAGNAVPPAFEAIALAERNEQCAECMFCCTYPGHLSPWGRCNPQKVFLQPQKQLLFEDPLSSSFLLFPCSCALMPC